LALFIYVLWSTTYPLKGSVSPEVLFKLDPLLMLCASLSERMVLTGIIFSLVMLGSSLIMGRFFCGWACPLGTLIDLSGTDNKGKILDDCRNREARKPKFAVLALIFLLAGMGIQTAWLLDPVVTAARFFSLNLIPAITFLIDGLFSWSIRTFHLYGAAYDLYHQLKAGILGVKLSYFSHALVIFLVVLAIFIAGYKLKRSWCRVVCPLGALYAVFGRFSLIRREVAACNHCQRCKSDCRMGAIKDGPDYVKGECILCLDCVYTCPQHSTKFSFSGWSFARKKEKLPESGNGISRRQFLFLAVFSGLPAKVSLKDVFFSPRPRKQKVLRPPAALAEEEFLNRCVRCGNCMKVCITNGLQPALFNAGLDAMWTPQLVPEVGYCEYHCTLCGNVCPTGAIPKLSESRKLKTRLGLARIDRNICIPWKKNQPCIVCEEHCPVFNKAITFKKVEIDGKIISRPYMNPRLCIGCGICQTKCPVRPERAIRVYPVRVTHGGAQNEK